MIPPAHPVWYLRGEINRKMKKSFKVTAWAYITLSVLSLLYVSTLAWLNPKEVMNLVGVTLPNPDSISSIRGVYGGAGLTLIVIFVYFTRLDLTVAVLFLTLFWGLYAVSRAVTAVIDGPLGEFGSSWFRIESAFCIAGLIFLLLRYVKRSG